MCCVHMYVEGLNDAVSLQYYNIPQNCFKEALNFSISSVSLTCDIKKYKHLTDSKYGENCVLVRKPVL